MRSYCTFHRIHTVEGLVALEHAEDEFPVVVAELVASSAERIWESGDGGVAAGSPPLPSVFGVSSSTSTVTPIQTQTRQTACLNTLVTNTVSLYDDEHDGATPMTH
jgi:hypothetical protein